MKSVVREYVHGQKESSNRCIYFWLMANCGAKRRAEENKMRADEDIESSSICTLLPSIIIIINAKKKKARPQQEL